MKTDLLKAADNLWVAVKAYVVSRNSYPEWNALHNAIAEYGRARGKPLRNCDLVDSYDEAEEKFGSYCVQYETCRACPLFDPKDCRARWLLAMATSPSTYKKGEN